MPPVSRLLTPVRYNVSSCWHLIPAAATELECMRTLPRAGGRPWGKQESPNVGNALEGRASIKGKSVCSLINRTGDGMYPRFHSSQAEGNDS